jgi:hypothetical protein
VVFDFKGRSSELNKIYEIITRNGRENKNEGRQFAEIKLRRGRGPPRAWADT